MNIVCSLSLILLATTAETVAVGRNNEQFRVRGHSTRRESNPTRYQRDLKGSKSSSKGRSCTTFTVYYKNNEFIKSFDGEDNSKTGTNVATLYKPNDREAGVYSEVTTAVGKVDCQSKGVYTLEFNEKGKPASQIFSATTCGSRKEAIVGGTGKYSCASGMIRLKNYGAKNKKYRSLYVCDAPCSAYQ